MKMTKSECRMTKEARSPKSEEEIRLRGSYSGFVIRISFVICHTSFGFTIV